MDHDAHQVDFSQPTRQIFLMLTVLILVSTGATLLAAQIQTVFWANPYLNGFIFGVFVFGVLATFWQVSQLISATNFLRDIQSGEKGEDLGRPPRLVASLGPILSDGRVKKRLAASTTRSILDSIAVRLDEARDITRYITNLLIFLGLLGTFWGLANTVPAVVDTIRSLAPSGGDTSDVSVFERLMSGLEDQLGGMGTAFASSLVGLAGSLIVGLLELFAGHGQNRFYRELEEWLGGFTRLGLVSEGEGPDGALVALLERVDEGLERTSDSAKKAEDARVAAETRLGQAADVVAAMAGQIDQQRDIVSGMFRELKEARDQEAARDHAMLTSLKRLEQSSSQIAHSQSALVDALEKVAYLGGPTGGGGADPEVGQALRSMDKQLRALADDLAVGRHETTQALRSELRALIALIDARTRGGGGPGGA
ncbi:MAG: biopolymer transporter ExbB [Pseudomonadota bacterium]